MNITCTIIGTQICVVLSILITNISLYKWLKSDINSQNKKRDFTQERMFLLLTGKTLLQAILEEKIKLDEKEK